MYEEKAREQEKPAGPPAKKAISELPWFVVKEMWWDWRGFYDSNMEKEHKIVSQS